MAAVRAAAIGAAPAACRPLVKWCARVAVLVLLGAPAPAAAQLPPDIEWRTIESRHFRVTFSPGLEALARHAAQRAEIAREVLIRDLAPAPRGRIDIVLTGEVDVANGLATPFPSNRIVLYAHPPLDAFGLQYHADWIDLLVTHELTHIFHLDRAGRVGHALRAVFGRVPASWPLFPAVGTPAWSIEGLAVEAESHLTGMGRLHGSHHEMAVRTAVLQGRFDPIDRVSNFTPIWPGGERHYVYGSLFMDYLARTYGEGVNRRILDRTADAVLPPALFFDRIGRRAAGRSFTAAFDDWRVELEAHYARLADSLTAIGLTSAQRVTGHGRFTLAPRLSPDGRLLAYAMADGRETALTNVIDLETGAVRWQQRRNSSAPSSWLPDGSGLVTSQLDFVGRYRLFGDLYLLTPAGERRLTHGARLHDPDVAPDGRRVVALQSSGATNRLVVYDLETGELQPLTAFVADVHWVAPRWAPDGARIAASRWTRGGEFNVVVVDARDGRLLRSITQDRAIDGAPAWAPDGRTIIFASDRTGIPNLYAAQLNDDGTHVLHQVTNVLTGVLQPEVSPDGRWIYFVGYHADGYDIERLPFDPSNWRTPAPFALERIAATRAAALAPDTTLVDPAAVPADTATGAPAPYHALRAALPRFWVPVASGNAVTGTFVGAWTAGRDLVGRHDYYAMAAIDPGAGRWQADVRYGYAGFGDPVIDFGASRYWSRLGDVDIPLGDTITTYALREREDVASIAARFVRPRLRSSAVGVIGSEFVVRNRELLGSPARMLADDRDVLAGAVARAAYARYRMPAFAISPQDGFVVSTSARHRWELGARPNTIDRGYGELTAFSAAYQSLALPGFAHHVLAVRAAALWRSGEGAPTSALGGATGVTFLPVRGFARSVLRGTHGWSASAEYRLPLALVGRGYNLVPVFLDRLSAAAFIDAGDIRCSRAVLERRPAACTRPPALPAVLASVGAELVTDAVFFFYSPTRIRVGVGMPLHDPAPRAFIAFGPSF